jgi:hypothetical protein
MNDMSSRLSGRRFPEALADPLDALLVEIAIRVQLPPGLHKTACTRGDNIQAYLSRPGSLLDGLITRFYPQGSMAIDATISTRGTDDEYDLDFIAEMLLWAGATPKDYLDLLYLALADYPVEKVERQTRCVTLTYADGMHVDVTPARRRPLTPEAESVIFHAKPEAPASEHREVLMNARGFATWYNARTPDEEWFGAAFDSVLGEVMKAAPTSEPVPDQVPLHRKSVTTVGLQLIKRFRNIWSANRDERYPPTVMLSCHAGLAAVPGMRLSEMVIRQARWTARAIHNADAAGQLLDVRNPVMSQDKFTDRWPENRRQQREFGAALTDLADGLQAVRDGRNGLSVEGVQDWLRSRFGARVVGSSVDHLFQRQGAALGAQVHGYNRAGNLFVPAAPAIIGGSSAPASTVAPRAHTHYGERR